MLLRGAPLLNRHRCCAMVATGASCKTSGMRTVIGGPRLRKLVRRCADSAGWIVPSGVLALLPKCPMCLAAYFAIGTGIGISISTAIYLRIALIVLCTASLSYFAASRGRRWLALGSGCGLLRRVRCAGLRVGAGE
jgi:hypothetical protein